MNIVRVFKSFQIRSTFNRSSLIDKRFNFKVACAVATNNYHNYSNDHHNSAENLNINKYLIGAIATGACYWYFRDAECAESIQKHETFRYDLPVYTEDDVVKHSNAKTSIWISYGIGVYDMSKYIQDNSSRMRYFTKGSDTSADDFWKTYKFHEDTRVLKILEKYRIGNLQMVDINKNLKNKMPKRRRTPKDAKPYLAEIVEHFITPAELFYAKEHQDQPDIDINKYKLHIQNELTGASKAFTMKDLETKFFKSEITAVVLTWSGIACGNARWAGVRLCDVLKAIGVEHDENCHVILEGVDKGLDGTPYAASLPLSRAMDAKCDNILAYQMNGEPLTKRHGFPLRCIVPGVNGARQVKWLERIVVTNLNLSKLYGHSDDCESADFRLTPVIQVTPVTSVICSLNPVHHDAKSSFVEVKGYAYSGGGNKISQVEVSWDSGKTWHATILTQSDDEIENSGRHYAWTLWSMKIPTEEKRIEVWSKAVDGCKNHQKEVFKCFWDLS